MSSRSAKRRRYSNIKNLLVNDLNSINNTAANLNEDIRTANEDFGLFFKSMEDRQSELFARTLGLEEKYRNIIEMLERKINVSIGESSQQSVLLNTAYSENERKFVEDTSTSIVGHMRHFNEHLEEMLTGFQTFEADWIKKINDWKAKAVEMEELRSRMSGRVTDFIRNI